MHFNARTFSGKFLLPTIIILLAFAIRLILFPVISPDMQIFLLPWYETIVQEGRWDALGQDFYNYMPAYIYLLDIATLFKSVDPVSAIKWISILFELIAGLAVYKILRLRFATGIIPWLGFLGLLFLPSVLIEGCYWGQCDIIYTSFLVFALYQIFRQKYFPAIIFFSIALAFKLQALLLAPVLVLLFLRRRISIFYFFIIPVVILATWIPALLAGRSVLSLLNIYIAQYDTYDSLSMNAPGLMAFADLLDEQFYSFFLWLGFLIAGVSAMLYLWIRCTKHRSLAPCALCFDAAFFAVILPFLLPKMHERYFFSGAVFLFILLFFCWDALVPALILQVSTLFSSLVFLSAGTQYWVLLGAILNLLAIILLLDRLPDVMNEDHEKMQPHFLERFMVDSIS